MDVRLGPNRKLSAEEMMLLNCGVGEDLENPLDFKEIQVHPKGNQSWIFIGRTDAEAETPILWPSDEKNWLTGKYPDAGKDWRREENDRGWDGWMDSLTQWTWVWASSGRRWWTGKLECCSPFGHKKSDTTERLNWCNRKINVSMKIISALICIIRRVRALVFYLGLITIGNTLRNHFRFFICKYKLFSIIWENTCKGYIWLKDVWIVNINKLVQMKGF